MEALILSLVSGGLEPTLELSRALRVHSTVALPEVRRSVDRLQQTAEAWGSSSSDLRPDEWLTREVASELREDLRSAEQQGGHLWDSLRLKLERVMVAMMNKI